MAFVSVVVNFNGYAITAESYDISTNRGRTLETETISPGSCIIRVRNQSANFNPYFVSDSGRLLLESGDALLLESGDALLYEYESSSSGAYGQILQGQAVSVVDGGVTVFTGYVEDYDYNYDHGGLRATATLSCRDSLGALGATELLEWQTTDAQFADERLTELLARDDRSAPPG